MAQSLEVNIKTTSDVPQAMEKAKAATTGFDKQLQDIGKKFSTSFKDIFLGFAAPMIILQSVMSYVSSQMAKAKQDAKDGLDLIATGESKLASSSEKNAANYFKRYAAIKEEERLVEKGRTEITTKILQNEGGNFKDFAVPENIVSRLKSGEAMSSVAKDKELQRQALEYFQNTEEGQKYAEQAPTQQSPVSTFTKPEGFSNVVGVGANPVMDAMNLQLEETKKQTILLESLVTNNPFGGGGGVPIDPTKSTSPSRASLLTGR